MRQNGLGTLTLDEARTWLEETGLCLFLPRRQFPAFIAPTFVEAVAGERNQTPGAKIVALAEDLLVRLEAEGVAVRMNLSGQPSEQPDFVVAGWVLPYVYALRGDRDWRRSPQLTGSRQVSQLAIQAYKHLETGDATIPQLKHALGREVSESAVLRAITELWQQLRIIPVLPAPGKTPQWQLLRLRFQKAIAEGASTSQVTAISVLASIYLQAVIAASMEEVELFLAPLTARSKVREVLRGLVATRQVHSLALGHAPHFYVAGTLPEFAPPATIYSSSAMPASTDFLRSYGRDGEFGEPLFTKSAPPSAAALAPQRKPSEPAVERAPQPKEKPQAARPRFSRPPAHARSRKAAQSSANGRAARRPSREVRSASPRIAAAHSNGGSRHAHAARWAESASKNGHAKHNGNGTHNGKSASNGNRFHANGNGASGFRKAKPAVARNLRNGHSASGKAAAKPASRRAGASRKDSRSAARTARGSRKPALTASAKTGNRSRYGFTASSGKRSKKRG